MILPLRQRHRRVFAALSVLLPVAFAVGIAARRPAPSVATLPAGLGSALEQSAALVWERSDLFAKAPVQVQLYRADPERWAVALSAGPDFVKPDLIVYWAAGNTAVTDELPSNAVLLGAFTSGALRLPPEAASEGGSLILFSLADQEVVDVSKPVRLNDSTR
jgi:hypothetical protein